MSNPEIATNWNNVLLVAKDEKKDLEKLELFSLDILARIDVEDAPSLTIYEITIGSEVVTYERQVAETTAESTQFLIDAVNNTRALYYDVTAIKGDFEDQILIQSKECFADIEVSVGSYLTAQTGKPFAIGGRSFILEEVANRCKESVFGKNWKHAQTYLAAHLAVQAKLPAPGLGSLSTESYPGGTLSFLIPALNPKADEEILMTTYGKRYNSFRKRRTVTYRVYG